MNKLLTMAILIIMTGCAINMQQIEHDTNFQRIYEVEASKNEIYTRSLQWLAKTYVDSKEVIEFKDKEAGKIIGRGVNKVVFNPLGISPVYVYIRYTINIDIKENRIRIIFNSFTQRDSNNSPVMVDSYEKLEPQLERLANELKTYVSTKENNDW